MQNKIFKLSVIIPVYNEENTIAEILRRVIAEKTNKEIIIIDDGSTDDSLKRIEQSTTNIQHTTIKTIHHPINLGKGAAIRTGIKQATGDVLIIQDADLEYDPNDYQRLLCPILEGKTKVVYGTRLKQLRFKLFGKNKTPLPWHYIANRLLSMFTNALFGSNLTDMETCYKVITRDVYTTLQLFSNRFEIEPELTAKILKSGNQIVEVPIQTSPRNYEQGKKIKLKDAIVAILTIIKYRFYD